MGGRTCLAVASAALLAGACYASAPAHRTLRVTARDAAATLAPVSITVLAPSWARSATLQDQQGRPVACDVSITEVTPGVKGSDRRATLTWLVAGLPQGKSRAYRLNFGKATPAGTATVTLKPGSGLVQVFVNGTLLTAYNWAGFAKPFLFPVRGPSGRFITRSFPMEEVPGEPTDHPHQRSVWFTHGSVNGVDFWTEGGNAGHMVPKGPPALEEGKVCARIRGRSDWVGKEGKVCEDEHQWTCYATGPQGGSLLDFEITIKATEGPVTFGDTKEGTFGVRVLPSMQVAGGGGHIVTSEGLRDGKAWGTRADWCDYYGPVEQATVGIAILDHPANLRHPTWWHVRDYGLFAANPFGIHDFTSTKGEPGAYTIPKGGSLTFRYRLYLHSGDTEAAKVVAAWADYATPPVVEVL